MEVTKKLTREEVKYASKDYVNYLLDKQEYHNEKYTEYDIKQAFEKGAMFADKNPDLSSLWHDASEVPQGPYIVLCDGLDNRQWVVEWLYIDMSYANWQDYVERISVSRWAYIKDLLPKGGEK